MLTKNDRSYWIIDWLSRHGPPEWHAYIERHAWDGASTEPLKWIINQPLCDAATAATIFWMSEPTYYLDGTHDDHEIAQLDLAIIRRWTDEGFPTGRFAFDEGFPEHVERINAGPHTVPASIAEPIRGTDVFPWFHYLPAEIDIAWHRANGREPPEHLLAAPKEPSSYVQQPPGKLTREECKRIWAALGPTSVFASMPATEKAKGMTARDRTRDIRSASTVEDASKPNTGFIDTITLWLGLRR